MSKNEMVAFGTGFRGYKKSDVNEYIEKISRERAEEQEKSKKALAEANDALKKQSGEISRMCAVISESDKLIAAQKEQIDAQKSEKEELFSEFIKLKEELLHIEERVNCETVTVEEEKKERIPDEKPEPKKEENTSLGMAIKTIKDKLAKLLK